jgi:hypothetical protein
MIAGLCHTLTTLLLLRTIFQTAIQFYSMLQRYHESSVLNIHLEYHLY